MRVAVIQSSYIPWRGYFDIIREVDLFVFYDDLQYSKGGWRNRNRIKTPQGPRWLTVPVHHRNLKQTIDEISLNNLQDWASNHLRRLEANYCKAPHYAFYVGAFADLLRKTWSNLSELNIALCHWVMGCLGIRTPTLHSRTLGLEGHKTDRLLQLLTKVGATTYLSGPSAEAYLEVDRFREAGIALEYKVYDYPEYPQLWGPFEGQVSILDLLFNMGSEAPAYLLSRSPNRKIL